MSFIKKEGSESSSLWDWVILITLVVGALSFWLYYRHQKNSTLEGFHQADSLFQAQEYQQALDVYNTVRYSDYLEPVHDSILSERLDTLFQILDNKSNKN